MATNREQRIEEIKELYEVEWAKCAQTQRAHELIAAEMTSDDDDLDAAMQRTLERIEASPDLDRQFRHHAVMVDVFRFFVTDGKVPERKPDGEIIFRNPVDAEEQWMARQVGKLVTGLTDDDDEAA